MDWQLRGQSERQAHLASALLRAGWVDQFRAKRSTLRFTDSSASNFDPLFTRRLIEHMRHEHPTLTSFFRTIHNDRVSCGHARPVRRANEIAPTSDDGALFHSSFLPPLQQSSA